MMEGTIPVREVLRLLPEADSYPCLGFHAIGVSPTAWKPRRSKDRDRHPVSR